MSTEIHIPIGGITLTGDLDAPPGIRGLVVFAHGSGSSRMSPRNRAVAAELRRSHRLGTLLFDLLTTGEDTQYANRFEIGLLADRLEAATRYALAHAHLAETPVGFFGASTGAAAAIVAATRLPETVRAVVSRGGRPDLAGTALAELTAPTLLIVGGLDTEVIVLNEQALARIAAPEKRLEIVPGATHLFEETGTLAQAAELALAWFEEWLVGG